MKKISVKEWDDLALRGFVALIRANKQKRPRKVNELIRDLEKLRKALGQAIRDTKEYNKTERNDLKKLAYKIDTNLGKFKTNTGRQKKMSYNSHEQKAQWDRGGRSPTVSR